MTRATSLAIVLAAGVAVGACVSVSRVGADPTSQLQPIASAPTPTASTGPATASPSFATGPTTASPSSATDPRNLPSTDPSAEPTATPDETPHRSEEPSIGYISLDERVPFVQAVSAGIRAAAASAGIDLIECDSGWTRKGALACAERLADAGIHGLISFHPFEDIATQACDLTGGAPTVGVVFDQGPCQVSRIHIDQAESGRLAGDAVGRFARERWDCAASAYVSLESSDADPDGRTRMEGYRAGYEAHCPLPAQTFVLDGADRLATAQTQIAGLLEELQDQRIVVVGLNEDAILGAMAAASAADRDDHLYYSGQLADPSIRQRIACDEQYIASVAQSPELFGSSLLPILMDALAGDEVPTQVDATLQLVTSANVRELFPDTPACDESATLG